MLHALAGAGAKREMLQAKGREIVEAGRPVRLRGVNLGGWMLIEDYMIGLPWTEWKIREQFKKILGEDSYSAFFNAFDQAFIASMLFVYHLITGTLRTIWRRGSGLKAAFSSLIASSAFAASTISG
jgi:hypothetical protein